MTAMIKLTQHEQHLTGLCGPPTRATSYLLPALATLLIHGAAAALLLSDWQPGLTAAPVAHTVQTRLVTLPRLAPAEPIIEPMAEPIVEPPVEPPAPPLDAPVEPPPITEPAPEPDQAAIARKQAQEREREKQAELRGLQEQRQAEQARLDRQRAEQARAEQQRIEQERIAAEHAAAQRALQAQREAAQRERQAAAADSAQYLPISKQAPDYPRRALDQQKEGDCVVEYTVTASGTVANPRVVHGACDPIFARPSIASASRFRYQPRIIDGKAVAVPGVRNTFRFRIENAQ